MRFSSERRTTLRLVRRICTAWAAVQEFIEGVDALSQGFDGHETEEAAARLHLMPQLLHVDGVIDALVDLRGLFLHDRTQMDREAQIDQENAEAHADHE